MEEQLSGGLYTACGQTPRIRELFSLEYENGLNTTCGVHVWGGYMAYIICHHKAKRLTNREFYVVRFLPVRLGHVLFKYLVYIRRLADLLRREQLGADKRGMTTAVMALISTPYSLGRVDIGHSSVGSHMDLMERTLSGFNHRFFEPMSGPRFAGMSSCAYQAKPCLQYLKSHPSL
ncbi:hypothetical protein FOXYS1_12886 [Fusarium oxysporum]|uniref:Uncharacterized protein n=1 Tax=Fusarium oxysporum TaxID=5507 RepID=A0A8H5EEJ7_FUSOX|nr:hypothetical protein FOXYS1_12886 [Fusarium oxysporum]